MWSLIARTVLKGSGLIKEYSDKFLKEYEKI